MKRGPDYVMIDRPADLAAIIPAIREAPAIAIDTESDSLYRYRERVCFMQIGIGTHAYLIDTITLTDLAPLLEVLTGPQLKILHGADYDLAGLFRDWSIRLDNVFDTMIASQLLGREHLGLAALVREYFGVALDKTLTRHDWGSRPLQDKHVRYLADDVVYLTGVHERLVAELAAQDLVEEASIEFARLLGSIAPRAPFDTEGFRHIRGANTLRREGLSILRELYLLRDQLAARANKPAFKVLGNHQMLAIADAAPRDKRSLMSAAGLPDHVFQRFGTRLLDAVDAGLANVANVPLRVRPKGTRPPDAQVAWTDALKTWRRGASERDRRTTMAILPNHLLHRVAELRPTSMEQLAEIPLFGAKRLARYGAEILAAGAAT